MLVDELVELLVELLVVVVVEEDVGSDVVVVVVDVGDVFEVGLVFVTAGAGFTTVTAASGSSASARSQALVSFSQPTNGAPTIARRTTASDAFGLDDQPGLR